MHILVENTNFVNFPTANLEIIWTFSNNDGQGNVNIKKAMG